MPYLATIAEVAELADALDSKSSVVTLRAGSSPAFGTIENTGLAEVSARSFFAKIIFVYGEVFIDCGLCYNIMYLLKGNSMI